MGITASGLRVEGVSALRGSFVLAPVTFEVAHREMLFITGENGAGKSTLLTVIAGLAGAKSGEIWWNRSEYAAAHVHCPPWRRDCALLLQDLGLWPHLTIRKQSLLVTDSSAAAQARIAHVAELLGVAALLDRKPTHLSGGEAQRCALVRTLAPARGLLLLDEPFSEQHDDGVLRIERVLAEEVAAGRAVIIAGHRVPNGARTLELKRAVGAGHCG